MIARNALCGLTWDRIVLDEAHRIRNKKTKLHLAALTLEGRFRWCLTGTPLQNRASDLEALLGFLGIGDYDPIKLHNNMLRRTSQASTCLNERIHWIDLSGEERSEYDALWEISIAEIEELIREGELRRNYPRILAIVLRLRQWLDHPSLPAPFQKYARSAVEHPSCCIAFTLVGLGIWLLIQERGVDRPPLFLCDLCVK
jgi:DNA repair protein RAD5